MTEEREPELQIALYGSSVLKKLAEPIQKIDKALEGLANAMLQKMYAAEGIGLAAPQVGISRRLIVIDLQDCGQAHKEPLLDGKPIPLGLLFPLIAINPSFSQVGKETTFEQEGCLSIPGVVGSVTRFMTIKANYQDLEGAWHTLETDGLLSRCIQHEVDHLNGVLFVERVSKEELKEQEKVLQTIKVL